MATELSHRTVLQSCLSTSWGGLEMVAFENALSLNQHSVKCCTLCIKNSPLQQKLKEHSLPTFELGPHQGLWDVFKIRQYLKDHEVRTVLVQHLKDMKLLAVALIQRPEISVVAISHTFLNVDKKDILHRWCYRKIKKMICLTQLQKQNLLSYLPLSENRMAILPNYVDCNYFHPRNDTFGMRKILQAPDGVPLLGIASRLDPQKGQDVALHAVKILKDRNIRVHLAIVGENTRNELNYFEVLRRLTNELGIEDRVYFSGYRDDMDQIMAALDILMMPSQCETFGRVLIEAMASKTPVIAARNGGVPDIITDDYDGLLVRPGDSEHLADAIARLVTDSSLRVRLSENAFHEVQQRYSKEVVEEKLLEILETA